MSNLETFNKILRSGKENWKYKEINALENKFPHSSVYFARTALQEKFPDLTFTLDEVKGLLAEAYE